MTDVIIIFTESYLQLISSKNYRLLLSMLSILLWSKVITLSRFYYNDKTYVKWQIGSVVMVEDGETADQLSDGLDGRRDVDDARVLGDEAVVAVALRLQDERRLLAVDRTEIWKLKKNYYFFLI